MDIRLNQFFPANYAKFDELFETGRVIAPASSNSVGGRKTAEQVVVQAYHRQTKTGQAEGFTKPLAR